jgi:uncharacterized protein YdaL
MDWLDNHAKEILRYQSMINQLDEDDYLERVSLLSKMLVLIGKVSAQVSEDYKKIYARRKQVHAEAYIKATKSKAAEAELAVVELRNLEAEAYGDYKRWGNAFESTAEEINVLKYKIRISIEDGSSRQGA